MRRLLLLVASGKPWIVFLTLCVALAAWLGAAASVTAQPSPTPAEDPTAPEIIPIDVVPYPDDFILYLVRIEFGPNVPAPPADIHGGEFVLTVDSGAVCYELTNVDSSTIVTANLLPGAAANNACNPNQDNLPCDEDEDTGIRTCTLDSGDKVYVSTGSSITQQGATPDAANVGAEHTYGNIDDEPAVVYLAGYQKDTGAGCAGGCM